MWVNVGAMIDDVASQPHVITTRVPLQLLDIFFDGGVESFEPEATVFPFGEKATQVTPKRWPLRGDPTS